MNRHIVVDHVTIEGAGNWWTIIRGRQVTLRSALRDRVDTDQVNGVGGALSDSSIDGLYIHHTKVGLWFDGPMDNLTVKNTIVADVIGDGVNFRRGVTNSRVVNSFFRNTGDDGMAMWSHNVTSGQPEVDENTGNVFDHNTVQTLTLANGIAIYGGRDNTVSNNIVADPIREGSGLHAGQPVTHGLRVEELLPLPARNEKIARDPRRCCEPRPRARRSRTCSTGTSSAACSTHLLREHGLDRSRLWESRATSFPGTHTRRSGVSPRVRSSSTLRRRSRQRG